MAKLYFRYGTVGSAKTLNLLAVSHNYRSQKKKVVVVKPKFDIRFGAELVQSRAGISQVADCILDRDGIVENVLLSGAHCVLADEAQFFTKRTVDNLREISYSRNIPVICYGLRADFRGDLFEGSRRLLEVADTIEEVKTTCHFCNKKATQNLKHVNGTPTLEGPSVDLGAEEVFLPACFACYVSQLGSREVPRAVGEF